MIEGALLETILKIFDIFFGDLAKSTMLPLNGVIYIVLFFIGATFLITRYWYTHQGEKGKTSNDVATNTTNLSSPLVSKSFKYITIVCGRREVHEKLHEILRNSQKGDQIYVSCNTCSYYPPQIYTELKNALFKGVTFFGIVRRTKDSEGFIQEVLKYQRSFPDAIQLFGAYDEIPIRMFGVLHKEVVISLMYKDGFLGIYFQDPTFADLMYSLFENTKKEPIAK